MRSYLKLVKSQVYLHSSMKRFLYPDLDFMSNEGERFNSWVLYGKGSRYTFQDHRDLKVMTAIYEAFPCNRYLFTILDAISVQWQPDICVQLVAGPVSYDAAECPNHSLLPKI